MPGSDLRDEMNAPSEPLLPVEKRLISLSVVSGLVPLLPLVVLNRFWPLG
jgi:hypothetical protein